MSFPTLPPAPVAPSRGQTNAVFNARMQAMMAYLEAFPDEWNAVAEAADEELAAAIGEAQAAAVAAFSASSTSSLSIGSGTKSFNATPGRAFIGGMEVLISSTAAPSTNNMTGTVTSYDASTGAMVVAVPLGSFNGAGTYASWAIAPIVAQAALNGAISTAVAGLVDGAPGDLNTLNKLATALALKANAADLGAAAALGIASQAQAEAGSASNVLMTPQRVAQAIAALAGWQQIGSPVSTASGTAWSFTNIPATYQDLYVLISGVSGLSSVSFGIELSGDNGANRTPYIALGAATLSSDLLHGGVLLPNYRRTSGIAIGGIIRTTAVNQAGTVTGTFGWRLNAAILNSLFFRWVDSSAGDAGTITLFGR